MNYNNGNRRELLSIPKAWARLRACCGLGGGNPADQTELVNTVQPTLSVDRFPVADAGYEGGTVSITTTGQFDAITVPAGEAWLLHAYRHSRAGGSWTFTDTRIGDGISNVQLATFAAASEYVSGLLGTPLPMPPGSRLIINVDSNPGSGDCITYVWVTKYPAPQ